MSVQYDSNLFKYLCKDNTTARDSQTYAPVKVLIPSFLKTGEVDDMNNKVYSLLINNRFESFMTLYFSVWTIQNKQIEKQKRADLRCAYEPFATRFMKILQQYVTKVSGVNTSELSTQTPVKF